MSIASEGHLLVYFRVRDPESPTQPTTLVPLSARSGLTKLLIQKLHRTYSHAGISALSSILAGSFVIPNLRNLLKHVSRACVHCQRAYAKPLTQLMGLLPSIRTTPAPPFSRTGVDFAGPITLKIGHIRKPTHVKCYAAVFICMTTKDPPSSKDKSYYSKTSHFASVNGPLAVVTEVHPGDDGINRAVTLRCHGKTSQSPHSTALR